MNFKLSDKDDKCVGSGELERLHSGQSHGEGPSRGPLLFTSNALNAPTTQLVLRVNSPLYLVTSATSSQAPRLEGESQQCLHQLVSRCSMAEFTARLAVYPAIDSFRTVLFHHRAKDV